MKELNEYIKKNRISESLESKVVSYIERHVKINPLGVIDWRGSAYSMLIEKVEKRNFIAHFFAMIKKCTPTLTMCISYCKWTASLPPCNPASIAGLPIAATFYIRTLFF